MLDLKRVSVPNQKLINWFLNMALDSHRVLLTGCDEIPVTPVRIDGWVQRPLNDEKLEAIFTEFNYRDRYATLLSTYIQCISQCETADATADRKMLLSQLVELRKKLDNMNVVSGVSAFDRTMREILQAEQNL